jgi:hypothetical protein
MCGAMEKANESPPVLRVAEALGYSVTGGSVRAAAALHVMVQACVFLFDSVDYFTNTASNAGTGF